MTDLVRVWTMVLNSAGAPLRETEVYFNGTEEVHERLAAVLLNGR